MDENSQTGFSAEERRATAERAAELRDQGRGKDRLAKGLLAVVERIGEMAPEDRALAEHFHRLVGRVAPQLAPKTWYGMPAYADEQGHVVVFFQDATKFATRYCTVGFQQAARLDEGPMWPVAFALVEWTPQVEETLGRLVTGAVS